MAALSAGRVLACALLLGAAIASLVFMIRTGGRNPSFLLLAMFTAWVLSPFVGAGALVAASKRFSTVSQAGAIAVALVNVLGSLLVYGGSIPLRNVRPAFPYLVVPFASWVLLVLFVVGTVLLNRGGPAPQDRNEADQG